MTGTHKQKLLEWLTPERVDAYRTLYPGEWVRLAWSEVGRGWIVGVAEEYREPINSQEVTVPPSGKFPPTPDTVWRSDGDSANVIDNALLCYAAPPDKRAPGQMTSHMYIDQELVGPFLGAPFEVTIRAITGDTP